MNPNELRLQRAKLIADARKIVDAAMGEKRSMNAAEQEQYDRMVTDAGKLLAQAEAAEKTIAADKGLRELEDGLRQPIDEAHTRPAHVPPGAGNDGASLEVKVRQAFGHYIRTGSMQQLRSLSMDKANEGGATVMPQQIAAILIKFVDDEVFMRQWATVHTVVGAHSLGVPSYDTDVEDGTWTVEVPTSTDEDSAMVFGKRELAPKAFAKLVKVSNKLLRNMPGVDNFVLQRLGYKNGVTEENAFMTGAGVSTPLGIFTADNNGIPTTRDVVTGSATAILADSLITAKMTLKGQYHKRPSTRWVMHRLVMSAVLKLKDGAGQYMYKPGLRDNDPDVLLNVPIALSEFAPSTISNGNYVAVLGDMSFYHIAQSQDIAIQRLVELYAATQQTGFQSVREVDGMPALAEAFVRLKVSA